MANSRLEKIGTIFSRVQGLIKSGALKFEERPIWYDVYEKFPPFNEPKFDQKIETTKIREIFYAEDKDRVKVEENKMFNLFEGRKKYESRKVEREPAEKRKLIEAKDLFDMKE